MAFYLCSCLFRVLPFTRMSHLSPITPHTSPLTPVIILAGGQGSRMQSGEKPVKKEMVPVGGRPILWHVMSSFAAHGFNRFTICLGHLAEPIEQYFATHPHPGWQVDLLDTGLNTEKGGRIAQAAAHIPAERYFVSYGDDVADVDLTALYQFHLAHGRLATLTAIQLNLEYGVVEADEAGRVAGFVERPRLPYWINGGYMLLDAAAIQIMNQDEYSNLETQVLPHLAAQGQLMMYRHTGFWKSMNTMKDNIELEKMWQEGAPWKIW